MTRVLLLDNYDSFTYNLAQALGALGCDLAVVRADRVDADSVALRPPDAIVISPGPGTPQRAGACMDVVERLSGRVPMLGVCLGHQAIGAAFGCRVVRAARIVHGKADRVSHDGSLLFAGVPTPFTATRYHSLVVDGDSLSGSPLRISAHTDDGVVMAVAHRSHPTFGVQFHPESVLTTHGERIIRNFVEAARART